MSTDIKDMDFGEVEMRVLAHMRKDAEKMDDTGSFRRPDDLEGYDTEKVRALLTLKEAQKILSEEGCQSVDVLTKKAAELYGCEPHEVNKAQRQFAKNYHFAEMYGCPQTFGEYLESRGLPKPIDEQ